MNNGLLPGPARRIDPHGPRLRAMCKIYPTIPAVGSTLTPGTLKGAFNIKKVVFNGVGDYTIHFSEPMPDKHYVVNLVCSGFASNNNLAIISGSDVPLADRKRIEIVNRGSGANATTAEVHFQAFA